MSQACTLCQREGVPGLISGHGKCPYHWAEGVWGRGWAAQCHPEHQETTPRIRCEGCGIPIPDVHEDADRAALLCDTCYKETP